MNAPAKRATAGDWAAWVLGLMGELWRACARGDRAAAAAWQAQVDAARAARAAAERGQP